MPIITASLLLAALINLNILYVSRKRKGYGDCYVITNKVIIQLRPVRIWGTVSLSLLAYGMLISSYYTMIGSY